MNSANSSPHDRKLAQRMARPQRHRLLHGYPMAPLLAPSPRAPATRAIVPDDTRPVIVGVLPHTFCNPTVKGCGFCTFPHEAYSNAEARAVAARVAREIRATTFGARRVDALYIGGGTANLTPPDAFAALAAALEATFDLSRAELTFEGVAAYFLARGEALLDLFAAMTARHRRLSVGVQTFDPAWLARMGRAAFGGPDELARLVASAHARGMTISCDLLFNLPDRPASASLEDVETAIALGFDQICVYNLVLERRLESAWAKTSLVDRVAKPEIGCATWLALRERLLARGFVQTTLTNFERRELNATDRRFVYEEHSFEPAAYDALGFGPGAIATLSDARALRAVKWTNEATSAEYVAAIDRDGDAAARAFVYEADDLRLLHVTRSLARLRVERALYRQRFGSDLASDFAIELDALARAELVVVDERALTLTPRGMFYADAVAGSVAAERVEALRAPGGANDATAHAMG